MAFAVFMLVGCQKTEPRKQSEKFAIKCVGTAEYRNSDVRNGALRTDSAGIQTYVINTSKREVLHVLEPRQQFEPVCGARKDSYQADVSPGLIQVNYSGKSGEDINVDCSFLLDRKSGHAELQMNLEFEGGTTDQMTYKMSCEPTEIPTFDTSRNKF